MLNTVRNVVVLGGSSFSPEAAALFARFTTPPTDARKVLINTLIESMKAAGVWAKLDAFYVIAAADAQAAQRNWTQDLYNLAPQGTLTFTADRQYAGDGSTGYLTTGAVCNALVRYGANSAVAFTWETTAVSTATYAMGDTSANRLRLSGRVTTAAAARVNDATALSVAVATSIGLTAADRSGANVKSLYKNGISIGSDAVATSGITSDQIELLRLSTTIYAGRSLAIAGFGGSLSAGEHLALYNACLAYLQGVGAA